jgi:methyl-accepting chemotaxis protein
MMIKLIKSRLGLKIAILVNTMLIIVIALGSMYLIKEYNQQVENEFYTKARILSITGAKGISRIFEEAIDNGVLSESAVFDTNYVQIPGIDPPKYHTKYDAYTDKAFQSYNDEFSKDKTIVACGAADINGYIPTHVSLLSQPLTGDPVKDKMWNRTKRIFNDKIGLAAAKNKQEGFKQEYRTDVGVRGWDVSSPIYVKGKQWGGYRVTLALASIDETKKQHAMALIVVMVIILCVSGFAVFMLIQKALAPLQKFTSIASDLADGNVEEKIESTSEDEIGQLANVLERLRVSIKSAMERLMKK